MHHYLTFQYSNNIRSIWATKGETLNALLVNPNDGSIPQFTDEEFAHLMLANQSGLDFTKIEYLDFNHLLAEKQFVETGYYGKIFEPKK